METIPFLSKSKEENEEDERIFKKYKELISTLPLETGWVARPIRQHQGCWCVDEHLHAIMAFQEHFKARHSDILLATNPRSGTTWLKALMFATANRTAIPPDSPNHPLLALNPHRCIPYTHLHYIRNQMPIGLDALPSPRLLATHIHYPMLPQSVGESDCRIVYVGRNPKDNLVSQFHFYDKWRSGSMEALTLEKAFELYYAGVSIYGPAWDHFLGYWKESLRRPDRVLFLKYEELKEDPIGNLKRLAEFMGCPFTQKEEGRGIVECISKLCSFEHLRSLEANNNGIFRGKNLSTKQNPLFRKAEVGGWARELTQEMADKLDAIFEEKLSGSGLTFRDGEE